MSTEQVSRPRVRASELAGYRKGYPKFDADARKFGLEAAIGNSMFVRGDDNGRVKAAEAVLPALRLLELALNKHDHRWTVRQKRAMNKAVRHCERGLKRKKSR